MSAYYQRLRTIRPNLMAFYDQFRGEGHTPAQAMQAAACAALAQAHNTTFVQHARAQGQLPPTDATDVLAADVRELQVQGMLAASDSRQVAERGQLHSDIAAEIFVMATVGVPSGQGSGGGSA
jgi:hypothetical protein